MSKLADEKLMGHFNTYLHSVWIGMHGRCGKLENYLDVTVCDEWQTFDGFLRWDGIEYWEKGCHLDKDIIKLGNRTYGPDVCAFVSPDVNQIIKRRSPKDGLPVGVSRIDGGDEFAFKATCSVDGQSNVIGHYRTMEEAKDAFVSVKAATIFEIAKKQKNPLVSAGLEAYAHALLDGERDY